MPLNAKNGGINSVFANKNVWVLRDLIRKVFKFFGEIIQSSVLNGL